MCVCVCVREREREREREHADGWQYKSTTHMLVGGGRSLFMKGAQRELGGGRTWGGALNRDEDGTNREDEEV